MAYKVEDVHEACMIPPASGLHGSNGGRQSLDCERNRCRPKWEEEHPDEPRPIGEQYDEELP